MNDRRKKKKLLPALLRVIGILMLAAVILMALPAALPRILGMEAYQIISASMEPEIPVGSVIYVKPAPPEEIQAGEIIAFHEGNSVIAHRVVENRADESAFVTKGDANDIEDVEAVPYSMVRGRVVRHIPKLGRFLLAVTDPDGRIALLALAACGAILQMIAGVTGRKQEA